MIVHYLYVIILTLDNNEFKNRVSNLNTIKKLDYIIN